MTLPHQLRAYEIWAPVVGRLLIAAAFLVGAAFKIPGTDMFALQVSMSEAAGLPFATLLVALAFVLELFAGVAIVVGWKTRLVAFVLMLYTILLTAIFHTNFLLPTTLGQFMSHLYLIGGLLYLSVYGAQKVAVETCPLPAYLKKAGS